MKALGRLERVDLRAAWRREDTDFTPWLARQENIALLGDTIRLELEVQTQEASVGPFRADILCRNTDDNSLVLIENQFERTDHGHLGQLMTYAAGLQAVTLVWIAERFTDEHRAALEWFNKITGEDFNFFGLEIELWKIGDSAPAPKFNIVVQPNEWAKVVKETVNAVGTTDADRLKLDYWAAFAEHLKAKGANFRPPKFDRAWNWHGWGLGRSYFQLCAAVNVRDGRNAVWINLSGPDAEAHFQLLRADRTAIEQELGTPLEWEAADKERKLIVRRSGDTTDRAQWPEQHAWLLETMLTFDMYFRRRVATLDASTWKSPASEP